MEPQSQPLVCPSHTTQYIGAVIVGIIIGAVASFTYFNQAPASIGGGTYQEGFNAAKKLVEESSFGMMLRTPDDTRTLSGTVTSVQGNRITIHTQTMNPFEDPALLDRTIIVTKDTKISKLTTKDPKVMQSETEAFMKMMQGDNTGLPTMPPEPFVRAPSDIASIIVGTILNVTATENIKTLKEFTASEIQVQQNMTPPIIN
ncbi:MAG TPA: hypothetical protein DCS23_00425 [Candidatus Yonathbacteria bacterium]|nr:hypothetical protein [Candidatus Yonathbacteria bacterium]